MWVKAERPKVLQSRHSPHLLCVFSYWIPRISKSDSYRSKELAKLCLPIGSSPGRTLSRSGVGERGQGKTRDFNFLSLVTKSSVLLWEREERQVYIWKLNSAVKQNHGHEEVTSPQGQSLTDTHRTPWPHVYGGFPLCFSEQYTLNTLLPLHQIYGGSYM